MYLVYVVVVVQIIVDMFVVIMSIRTLTSMAAEFINFIRNVIFLRTLGL